MTYVDHSSSRRRLAAIALLAALAALIGLTARSADRDALRHIVQDQCLPHWRAQHDPAPCARIDTPEFAVLADRKGGAHFLLIATRTLSGIEDPQLLRDDAPNYFAAAWQARDRLATIVGHPLRRDAVGLAINSSLARGQDQLHIHIECQQPRLHRLLQAEAADIGEHWAPLRGAEFPFLAMRLRGEELDVDPFALLASGVPDARAALGAYTVVVAGMQFDDGPGFIVLAGRTPSSAALLTGPPGHGLVPPGETLLDSSCAVEPEP